MDWESLPNCPQLVVALDLDGTLIPHAPTPADARVDGDTAAIVEALAQSPGVTLAIVTGRKRELVEDLPARFPSARIAAEHGAWRCENGVWELAVPAVPPLDELDRALTSLAAMHPGALVERKTCSVCLHWRLVATTEREAIESATDAIAEEWLETHKDMERLPCVEALEIRHHDAHKGRALAWLRSRAIAGTPALAVGDDTSDEDMFASLGADDVGIVVAREARRTEARYRLPDPSAVHRFVHWLVDARARRHPSVQELAIAPTGPIARGLPGAPATPPLVVVSNRLPNLEPTGRTKEVGGLVSALLPMFSETSGMWLGWSGLERDPGLRVRVQHGERDAIVRAEFDYPTSWRKRFYAGFCNQSLWPLLHDFVGRVRYVDDEWACYGDANRAYAAAISQISAPDAEVWVQDFHLALVGRELRRGGHHGRLGFYLHVPFPPRDSWETMPWSDEVLAALLDYDLVGVQCERWRDNLVASVHGALGRDAGARAEQRVRAIPVGIDPDRIASSATAGNARRDVYDMLNGRRLILGVDRLDYSKGIPERLEAFARMLELFPAWRGKVSFIQISVPTRSDVADYAEMRSRVESLVGRINGAYGEADWTPVRYLYRSYDQETLAKLYRAAAVALVTPLRDGLNLVAKEYVAAQDGNDPGVLVLSKFAGAAERLGDALVTNPYHVDGVAADLDRALRMARDERVRRWTAMRDVVWTDSATAWAQRFRAALHDAG
jgi:trehalose 6-phosphate synthase|nr:trehalose-phosphatase [Kofleriaceae bacterium]